MWDKSNVIKRYTIEQEDKFLTDIHAKTFG